MMSLLYFLPGDSGGGFCCSHPTETPAYSAVAGAWLPDQSDHEYIVNNQSDHEYVVNNQSHHEYIVNNQSENKSGVCADSGKCVQQYS